jgi:SAM-dependent methyltransferase
MMGETMWLTLITCGAIFLSSLLLFLIQPIITKAILPWFGGSAGVWTSAILFFQVFLLLGYAYANAQATYWLHAPRRKMLLHLLLLAASLCVLPVAPSLAWKPTAATEPVTRIVAVLALSVGFPYLLLATTGPLLQHWYARRSPAAFPYRLFAISNAGSLAALMLYPFVIEPVISVRRQLLVWSVAYAAAVVLVGLAAWLTATRPEAKPAPRTPLPVTDRLLWIALAACPSVLWLGVANELSQNVAPIPLLWILPLCIYLLSFILCFDRQGWYQPAIFRIALPAACVLMALFRKGATLPLAGAIALLSATLFVCCMFCHGELARRKPHPTQLTSFYLMLALGGALGGLFVGVAAPLLFNRYLELPVAIVASAVLALGLLYAFPPRRLVRLCVIAALAFVAATQIGGRVEGDRLRVRNFYGALRVGDAGTGSMAVRTLSNGPINHGGQFLSPGRSRWPTTYYGPDSGAALAIRFQPTRPHRVGVVGLGAGTLASYGQAGDVYRFYELNPAVIALANTEFQYLRECPCTVTVVPGDGRISLEREPDQNFDVLVVDAFNGDSIPVHLLTREAFAAWRKQLRPDGILAVHVTNRYLDLTPVVQALAEDCHLSPRLVRNPADPDRGVDEATWVLASANPEFLAGLSGRAAPFPASRGLRLWTDDYSNLFQLLR